jgi:HK97 family phage major capsid protein
MSETRIKAQIVGEGRIGGYLILWGTSKTRDLHGEYFTPQTELGLDWYAQRPVLYQHGLDGQLKAAVIGQIDLLRTDETGVWAEAQLDLRQRYVRAVLRLVEKGVLHWSSGSLAHLVQVTDAGEIQRWPVVEGSLTPTPAEPRRTDVQTIKSAYGALGLDMGRLNLQNTELILKGHESMTDELTLNTPRKRLPMSESAEAVKSARITVASEFDPLNALDMLHGYVLMRAAKSFHGVSERYANALADKVQRAGLSAIKSDELATSTQAGYGDEWVPELWSAQIWHKARTDNVLLPQFPSLEMPSNPYELATEGTDPTVSYVSESKDEAHLSLGSGNPIADSKIGSGKVQLSAKKLALRVGFSSELVEDSIIPVLTIYREQAVRALADAMDNVILNGDTTSAATGNVNSDNATPTAGSVYLAMDGLRKQPITTTTANAVDMGNVAPTLAKLREARFKLATRYSARPQDLSWVVDGGTYAKLLSLSEFLTVDKAGPHATILTGQIGFIDGVKVLLSAQMPLTEADGKVGAVNSRGTALCVYTPGWYIGYRRRIAVSVDYLPYYDSYQLTATVRLAFASIDAAVTSVLYNIAV